MKVMIMAVRTCTCPRIVALGDSLTAGLGVSPDQSYPARLQDRLEQAGFLYRVINAGVSGDTTAGGLRRLDWVLKTNPRIVIVELGANDALRGQPLAAMYSNLSELITRLQDKEFERVGGNNIAIADKQYIRVIIRA